MTLPLAGAKIRASDLLGIFPQNTDAWIAYTPAWTASGVAPAIGNGTITGFYTKIGRTVFFRIIMVAGTTTTYGSGTYAWSLPVAASSGTPPVGRATVFDTSVPARFNRDAQPLTATTVGICSEAGAFATNLVPMTWANTDFIGIQGYYEATS